MAKTRMTDEDRDEVADFIDSYWGSRVVMSRGRAYQPHQLEGLIDRRDGKIVGLLTFRMDDEGMEILTLNSTLERRGIGMSLMLEAIDEARTRGATRVWLTTTNANLRAIGYYQRMGFRMNQVNVGAVDEARKIKPEIPLVGPNGIRIHDEIVMELGIKPFIEQVSQ